MNEFLPYKIPTFWFFALNGFDFFFCCQYRGHMWQFRPQSACCTYLVCVLNPICCPHFIMTTLSVANRSIICWSQRLRQIIDQQETDKSQYFAISKFSNCFIIWSLFFWSTKDVKSLSLSSGNWSAIFTHDHGLSCGSYGGLSWLMKGN